MNFYFKTKNGERDNKSYLLHEAMAKIVQLHHEGKAFIMSTELVDIDAERLIQIKGILKQRKLKKKEFAEKTGKTYLHIIKVLEGNATLTEDLYRKMCEILETEVIT